VTDLAGIERDVVGITIHELTCLGSMQICGW
jgi:hypothetical protein